MQICTLGDKNAGSLSSALYAWSILEPSLCRSLQVWLEDKHLGIYHCKGFSRGNDELEDYPYF